MFSRSYRTRMPPVILDSCQSLSINVHFARSPDSARQTGIDSEFALRLSRRLHRAILNTIRNRLWTQFLRVTRLSRDTFVRLIEVGLAVPVCRCTLAYVVYVPRGRQISRHLLHCVFFLVWRVEL